MENSSESSQDNTDSLTFTNIQNLSLKLKEESLLDFVEADDLCCEDLLQNITEDDIFKDLQDEAGMNSICMQQVCFYSLLTIFKMEKPSTMKW